MKDLIFCRFYNRNPSLITSQRATAGQSCDPSSQIHPSEAQRDLSEAQPHLGFPPWDSVQQPSVVLSLLTHSGAQEISLLPATGTQWPVATSSPIFLLLVSVVTVAKPHLGPWPVPWPPWQGIASQIVGKGKGGQPPAQHPSLCWPLPLQRSFWNLSQMPKLFLVFLRGTGVFTHNSREVDRHWLISRVNLCLPRVVGRSY